MSSPAACLLPTTLRLRAQGCFTSRGTPPRLFAPRTRCPLTRHAATVGRDGFTYLSPEAAERIERELEEARQLGLQEYQELKDLLLKRTWRFGTLFALYLLLAASAEAALCELLGAGASYGYLLLLFRDVDSLQPGDRFPMREAEEVEPKFARWIAKWLASYRHALRPRLLVLVGLVAAIPAYGAAFPDEPLTLVEQGCLVGGFLAYKVALLQKVYDDLKPKVLTAEELMQEPRPSLVPVGEDVEELLWKKEGKDGDAAGGSTSSSSSAAEAAEKK